jgi:hypothetical protein
MTDVLFTGMTPGSNGMKPGGYALTSLLGMTPMLAEALTGMTPG